MSLDGDLPAFPLDDQTLALLDQALDPWSHGDPCAESSSLEPFLSMVSEMAGSDVTTTTTDSLGLVELHDPVYSSHDLIRALVAEVRRLRMTPTS
jgi:hypothetical protein